MVWIPGGEFSMGANDPPDMDDVGMKATLDARPIHRVYVDGFLIDRTDVTNARFAEFAKPTGYARRWRSAHRDRRIFPEHHRKVYLPAALFFLRPTMRCLSTITCSGGAM